MMNQLEPEPPRIERVKILLIFQLLEKDHRENIEQLIETNEDCFYLKNERLGATKNLQHWISTVDNVPVKSRPYRFPLSLKQELDNQFKEMLKSDITESLFRNYCYNDSQGNKCYMPVVDSDSLKSVRLWISTHYQI